MKFLSIIVLLFCAFLSKAQYVPITQDSSEWRVLYSHKFQTHYYTTYVGAFYNHQNDTLINGLSYDKFIHYSNGVNPFNGDFLVREDTSNKRVFVRYPNHAPSLAILNKDYLFYDFSLDVGDTLFTGLILQGNGNDTVYWKVTGKDSTMVNGKMRTHLDVVLNDKVDFDPGMPRTDRWIEGIGSEVEFNNPISIDINVFESFFQMVCYKNLSEGYEYETHKTQYNCNSSIELQESKRVNQTEVFPNPFQNELQLNFGETPMNGVLSLTSISGIILKEIEVDNLRSINLSTQELAKGMYILKISNDGFTESILVEKY